MRFYPFQLLITVLLSITFTACDWLDSDPVATSNNARFVSLRFSAGDATSPNVSQAVFTVSEFDGVDSIIVNVDSLPYGTKIDKVIPSFSFYSTYVAYVYRNNELGQFKDSIALSGKDTLDFNSVYKVSNKATDQKAYKTYKIKVNVHKVDPELYQWRKAVSGIYDHPGNIQKAIFLNNKIYFFTSTGLTTSLYTSTNGTNWSTRIIVDKLPDNVLLANIVTFKNKMYLIHNDTFIYTSEDGVDWTKLEPNTSLYTFKNLLFEFKTKLWAIIQSKSDSKYRLATSADGVNWTEVSTTLNDNFPVGGYSAVAFASRTKQPKVLVAGGFNKNGVIQNSVWSSEDGINWLDFSKENTTFGYRTGVSLVNYEDKLLMFGGVDNNETLHSLLFMQSADEGFSWKDIDSTKMTIRMTFPFQKNDSTLYGYRKYERRFNQSVVVDNNKNIILIGGRDSIPTIFTDVWIGRLNKSVFIRK
jgi:hypothetical protein